MHPWWLEHEVAERRRRRQQAATEHALGARPGRVSAWAGRVLIAAGRRLQGGEAHEPIVDLRERPMWVPTDVSPDRGLFDTLSPAENRL